MKIAESPANRLTAFFGQHAPSLASRQVAILSLRIQFSLIIVHNKFIYFENNQSLFIYLFRKISKAYMLYDPPATRSAVNAYHIDDAGLMPT
jgi:hypothetical protein